MSAIKNGTCAACVRALEVSVSGRVVGWDWTVDPDGPFLHWARAGRDGLYKDGFVAREFDTACGAKLLHVRRAAGGKPS